MGELEEYETAKQRLVAELHEFLADVLKSDSGQIEEFAQAVRGAIERQGGARVQLGQQVEARLDSIDQALRDSRTQELEAQLNQFRRQVDAALKAFLAGRSDQQEIILRRIASRHRASDESGDEHIDEAEPLRIQLRLPRPDWMAWLPAAIAAIGTIVSIGILVIASQPARMGIPGNTPVAAVSNPDPAQALDNARLERGWDKLLEQMRSQNATLPITGPSAICAAREGGPDCADFATTMAGWKADPLLPPALAAAVRTHAPAICPASTTDGIPDDHLSGLLACLRIAGAP